MLREFANYHVGLKILLKKGDKILFLKTPSGLHFDLPGGRMDNIEHNTPLPEILAREVKEELGEDLKYKLGKPLFQFRRHVAKKDWRVFLTVYEAQYLSGDIQISDEHSEYLWINPNEYDFKEGEFVNPEEYLAFIEYFVKL